MLKISPQKLFLTFAFYPRSFDILGEFKSCKFQEIMNYVDDNNTDDFSSSVRDF